MHINTALQDDLLNEIVNEKVPTTVFLLNGFQISGMIAGHDDAVVVMDVDGKQQIVYKRTISTIIPIRPLKALKDR